MDQRTQGLQKDTHPCCSEHPPSRLFGRCTTCAVPGPCPHRSRKELTERLEAEVAVVVRQVRRDTRADDARERVPREVERLEDVESEDERRDIGRGRRWWMGE